MTQISFDDLEHEGSGNEDGPRAVHPNNVVERFTKYFLHDPPQQLSSNRETVPLRHPK